MNEATVKCGCGRTMHLDGRAGRGAYRCGCGARVQITIPLQRGACVGQHKDGPCRLRPVATDPLPLCEEHYVSTGLQELSRWRNLTPPEVEARAMAIFNKHWRESMDVAERGQPIDPDELERLGIVYFIQSQQLVKIGTTTDVVRRMNAFSVPHITLLAAEPGYKRRERELHLQFADLRVNRREWFRLEGPLVDHINAIRASHALPAIQVDKIPETP